MAQTITVSTTAELLTALKSATGGETILLAGGNYGKLSLVDKSTFDMDFTSTVTIAAADPGNPPVVTGLDVRSATNLSFEGISFDYTYVAGQPLWSRPFKVSDSDGISMKNCTFEGDVASGLNAESDGFPTAFGLSFRGCADVRVENCEISNFYRGLVVGGSDDVQVLNNNLHTLRMDGMNFSSVQGVTIEGNYIHDFTRSDAAGDHADMIQFWTNGAYRPSTDIVIRNNVLDIGEGDATQSIFMRNDMVDRGLAGEEMYYQNILIEGNLITNAHTNAIAVGETAGLIIRNNTVLHADGERQDGIDSSSEIPKISVAGDSTDVIITQNVAANIFGHAGQPGWTVANNVLVQDQDPNAPNHYSEVFLASSLNPTDGKHLFIAAPGSVIEQLGAGAPATLTQGSAAAFQVVTEEPGARHVVFDASVMGGTYPAGTVYHWTFGDGTTATGQTVTHSYKAPGDYQATLTVALPDGSSSAASASVAVQNPNLLRLNADGSFSLYPLDTDGAMKAMVDDSSDIGLQLGGGGNVAKVEREDLRPLFWDKDLSISFSLKADSPAMKGEVFRMNGSFIVSVEKDGSLLVRAWSSEGNSASLKTTVTKLSNMQGHDYELRLEEGRLALWADGVKQTDAAFDGTFANKGSGDLLFGNPWGATNFNGDLTAFAIDLAPGVFDSLAQDLDMPQALDMPQDLATDTDAAAPDATVVAEPPPVQPTEQSFSPSDAAEPTEALPVRTTSPLLVNADGTLALYQTQPSEIRSMDTSMDTARQDEGADIQPSDVSTSASIAQDDVATLLSDKDLSISFTLDASSAQSKGEIFRVDGSLVVSIGRDDSLLVQAWSSEGDAAALRSTGIRMSDMHSHAVEIRLEDGRLGLWLDGTKQAETAFNGTFADRGTGETVFSEPSVTSNFYGDLSAFAIDLAPDPLNDPFTGQIAMADAPLL